MNQPESFNMRPTRRGFIAGASALAAVMLAGRASAQSTPVGVPPFPAIQPLPEVTVPEAGPIRVTATTNIIADLVVQIGGARVDVATILPANADPHEYEPAPDDIAKVEDAKAVFVHGLGLDQWIEDIIDNAGGSVNVVTVTDGIATVNRSEGEDHDDESDDDDHDHETDPHVWFDPTKTAQMAANIANGLTAADPDGSGDYASRLSAYQQVLADLDTQIQERIALIPEDRRKIVTNHDALGYYADRYGLTIVGTVIPSLDTQAEPSAKEVADLLDTIKAQGVTVIFAENTVSPTLAQQLAGDAGITVVDTLYSDSLGDADSGAATYIEMMQSDTIKIVDALIGA
jgi:zinc/manganese transport system substrate-binding protein/manganese/iron transport system substrate-binding protein